MGCFNVSCSISKISINNEDPVVFIPLMINDENVDNQLPAKDLLANTSFYTDSFPLYKPLFLPIFGLYNDYGSLKNIKKGANTKAIEKLTGLTIEDFLDSINDNDLHTFNTGDEKLDEILLNTSGMFIHKDVYDQMILGHQLCDAEYITEDILLKLDFNFLGLNSINPSYKIFQYPEEPSLCILNDNRGSSYFCDTNGVKNEKLYIFSLKNLYNECEKKFNIILKINKLKNDSLFSAQFDTFQKLVIDYSENNSSNANNSLAAGIAHYAFLSPFNRLRGNLDHLPAMPYLEKTYKELFIDGTIKKELNDFQSFCSNLFKANCILEPTCSGTQWGDNKVSKRILDAALLIVDKRIIIEDQEAENDDF